MDLLRSLTSIVSSVLQTVFGVPGSTLNAVRSFIQSAVNALFHFTTHVYQTYQWVTASVIWPYVAANNELWRWQLQVDHRISEKLRFILRQLVPSINQRIAALTKALAAAVAKERSDIAWLVQWLSWLGPHLKAYTREQVAAEHQAMLKQSAADRSYTRGQISALHQSIENEAASGYNSELQDHLSVISKILDIIAGRNPELRSITKDVVDWLLNLVELDNPVLRFAGTLILNRLIAKLGIDRVIGDTVSALLGTLVSDGKAKNLHDVERDVCARLNALERQWSVFLDDGGPEVLQAGRLWKDGSSLLADAALVAFLAYIFTEPVAAARETNDTVGAAVRDTVNGFTDLIRSV